MYLHRVRQSVQVCIRLKIVHFTLHLSACMSVTTCIALLMAICLHMLPGVLQKQLSWHRLLTQRLTQDVKLVGPVISCEGSPYQGNVTADWRTNPHVQSYVLAMDQEALQILIKDNTVLNCYNDRWDAVYFGELGSSLAVLKAGKNIDSFLPK